VRVELRANSVSKLSSESLPRKFTAPSVAARRVFDNLLFKTLQFQKDTMSLPTELRLLCHQLTSTPPSALPRAVPSLIRHVLKCRGPLATQANPTTKKDTSEASVLIHKLKTQISTLLQSRNVEQRYAATTLVKAVTDVAGWDILKGSDAWVRGLLLILGVGVSLISQ
jgi:hypothetical protein